VLWFPAYRTGSTSLAINRKSTPGQLAARCDRTGPQKKQPSKDPDMAYAGKEYQDYERGHVPGSSRLNIVHKPTGVTLMDLPSNQMQDRGHRHWLFHGGDRAAWKAELIEGGTLDETHAKAIGLPFETREDKRFYDRNIGAREFFFAALPVDDAPLPPWSEALVSILLHGRLVARNLDGSWEAGKPPPPFEIVFEVKTAPPHLFGQRLIVRYGDR
jgi:hypothetical protein